MRKLFKKVDKIISWTAIYFVLYLILRSMGIPYDIALIPIVITAGTMIISMRAERRSMYDNDHRWIKEALSNPHLEMVPPNLGMFDEPKYRNVMKTCLRELHEEGVLTYEQMLTCNHQTVRDCAVEILDPLSK